MMNWEDRYVAVCIEGGHRRFFDRFLMAVEVASLVIVTPWITADGENADQMGAIVKKIEREKIVTTLVVRNPSREPVNKSALDLLAGLPTVTPYFNNELHAKVYVCRCAPFGFAYAGSANLTGRGTTAYEVGLIIEGKGAGQAVVEELERVGTVDLMNRAGTQLLDKEPYLRRSAQ